MTTTTTTVPAQTSTGALSGTYAIDPTHSRIGFVARHAMVTKVRGSFNEFEGSGFFDAENPSQSSLQLTIQAASIDTRNADRDAHLRSNDFFDMDTHPEITFTSTAVQPVDDEHHRVTGDLTIKGVTKPVTIDLEYTGSAVDPYGNQRIGFEGQTTVNRKDWGVNWNAALDAGGVLVSEKVTLEFEVSAIRIADSR
jgi:polyisoprenoid-binding protein YceI